jgi:hypothetical protein
VSAAFIVESATSTPEKCRCGVRIDPGQKLLRVGSVSQTSDILFRGQVFCSARCLRQFCLESLETLDGLDTPESSAIVSDFHDFYAGLAEIFSATLNS